jgi:hypothetical protein
VSGKVMIAFGIVVVALFGVAAIGAREKVPEPFTLPGLQELGDSLKTQQALQRWAAFDSAHDGGAWTAADCADTTDMLHRQTPDAPYPAPPASVFCGSNRSNSIGTLHYLSTANVVDLENFYIAALKPHAKRLEGPRVADRDVSFDFEGKDGNKGEVIIHFSGHVEVLW